MEFTDGECLITGIEIKSIIFHEKCHEVNLTTTKELLWHILPSIGV
jgi:hypothetical protein